MSTMTTSWPSGGATVSVTSTQVPGQTFEAFVEAHVAEVRAQRILHPPD